MKRIFALILTLMLFSSAFADSASSWTPREAPAVRHAMTEEVRLSEQAAILEKGTLLFSGEKNKGYHPKDRDWLHAAKPTDYVILTYACDDAFRLGWKILNFSVRTDTVTQSIQIDSDKTDPTRERTIIYQVSDFMELVGVDDPALITTFYLAASNGGRIASLYYLSGDAADEMRAHLAAVAAGNAIVHTYQGELSNPNAIPEAQAVYAYLKEIWGKGTLTGQMESTWRGSPDYEMNLVESWTGKLPAIRGLDFMHNDFRGVTSRAIAWWEKGGISHICWHTGPDFASGYDESQKNNLDWDRALTPGTAEYEALLQAMDRAVPYLQQLEDAGVPVLWRPFHELDGGWFWWSKGGPEGFVKLWQLMYSRYTDYWGLDNLIWVLGYSNKGGDLGAWYPGDSYVDLIGGDSYDPGANGELYEAVRNVAPTGMPIVFHECGTIPTRAQMSAENAPWLMFMVWHTDHIDNGQFNTPQSVKEIYQSDWFITLDELPDFK